MKYQSTCNCWMAINGERFSLQPNGVAAASTTKAAANTKHPFYPTTPWLCWSIDVLPRLTISPPFPKCSHFCVQMSDSCHFSADAPDLLTLPSWSRIHSTKPSQCCVVSLSCQIMIWNVWLFITSRSKHQPWHETITNQPFC